MSVPVVAGRHRQPQRAPGAGVRAGQARHPSGADHHRCRDGRVQAATELPRCVSGRERLHRGVAAAPRGADARLPADADGAGRRCSIRAADCLCKRSQPAARPSGPQGTRDGDPRRAWGGPVAAVQTAPDRERRALSGRRNRGTRPGGRVSRRPRCVRRSIHTRSHEIGINGTVLLFTLGIAVGTGILVGIIPAFPTRTNVSNAIQEGGRNTGEAGSASGAR